MDFYKKILMDHYKNPRNYGKLENPNISTNEYIPSCGDSIQIQCIIADDILCNIAFTGKGCIISQATSSIITQYCKQKNVNDLLKIDNNFIINMIGIQLGPNRIKCALLPLFVIHKAIEKYKIKDFK